MDVREKLVELFRNAFAAYGDGITGCTREEFFADFIAGYGGTVQEWISVKDRLPEGASTVLAVDLDGTIATAYYVGRWHGGGDLDENAVIGWMPLPSPPTCKDCKFYEKECEDHAQRRMMGQERGMEICEIFCYLPQPPKGE